MELRDIPDPDPVSLDPGDDTGSKTSPEDTLLGQRLRNTSVEGPSKHFPVYIINKGKCANVLKDLTR